MAQKFGVQNLKKVISFALSFNEELASALKDGKFKWVEAFGFIDELMQVDDLIKAVPQDKNEIAELSTEEMKELREYVEDNFEIQNATVEEVIDASFDFITGATKLIGAFKK